MGAESSPASRSRAGLLLAELQNLIAQIQERYRAAPDDDGVPPSLSARALTLYKARRARAAMFNGYSDLFGEPAWDLLLDLFIAREANRQVSVSSACIAADVPATTALRWLAILEQRGLVERRADAIDGRRIHIRLSDSAAAMMERWLELWA